MSTAQEEKVNLPNGSQMAKKQREKTQAGYSLFPSLSKTIKRKLAFDILQAYFNALMKHGQVTQAL